WADSALVGLSYSIAAAIHPTRLVLGSGEHHRSLSFVLRRQLLRPELIVQLVDRSRKAEWDVIREVHRRAGIESDVKGLVNGHEQWNRVRDRFACDFVAIHRQHTRASLGGARSVILEVEH